MRINLVDPGYTATDFNPHRGRNSVEEGAEIIIRVAQIGPDDPTGAYQDRQGTSCPGIFFFFFFFFF